MAIYTLKTQGPPTITLQNHTFTFRIYVHPPASEGPHPRAIGEFTFQKPASEPWPSAALRFKAAVSAWLSTYEQSASIDQAVSAWLQTQEWAT